MTDIRKPRRGSMGYRPRKRAWSQNARVYWQPSGDSRVLGFPGYKVGMTQASYLDDSESPTKGQEIMSAATVIEVPPIMVYGVRCYRGRNSLGDILVTDEKILKLIGITKKREAKAVDESKADDVRLLVYAMPAKAGLPKKHIEKMELGCGGADPAAKIAYCKGLLGKELKFKEVFKSGEFVDIVSVTTGKGWQGAVKRFGVALQRRKATGKKRHVGTLGQWHPAYVLYTIPQAGQTGYHQRTELNKRIIRVGDKPEEINPSAGFPSYGFVRSDFVVVRGSVPGPAKRLLKLRAAVRAPTALKEMQAEVVRF